MSWIDVLVDQYKETETPQKFMYWAGLSAISAVMQKRVFLDRHIYKLYPNIYVLIMARSGMRKGTATTVAKKLVEKSGSVRIISGRNSMQAIIRDLSKAYTLDSGAMIKDAQSFIVSGELGAFLVKDPDALTILTDLHDTHANEPVWINSLKVAGIDKLKDPCITLLGATNEEHFESAVLPRDIKGGFIARSFIVLSNERGVLNSLTRPPQTIPELSFLSIYLRELANISGEFTYGQGAADAYDAWYYPFMQGLTDSDPTGTYMRIGDQILKVAMLLSLADSPDLVIKESNIVEAITVSLECVQGMKQVTMGAGRSNLAAQTKIVMRDLLSAPLNQVTRAQLLSKHWGEFTDFDLDRIVATLEGANAVEVINAKNCISYRIKKSALDMYTKVVRSIQ